ncbi:hypothetical protein T484DRAFT_1789558, partial [Baffinella frigidus]
VKCARIGGFDVDGNARGGMNLFVPAGFANGRELMVPPNGSRGDDFKAFVEPHFQHERKLSFGRISWDSAVNPAQYVRVPLKECLPALASPSKNAPREAAREPHNQRRRVGRGELHTESDFGALPDLMKFFCERVWKLKRPKLLISVMGSSQECDIQMEDREALLNGFMELANETNAWIVTNGLDTGVSKLIGQAKKEKELKAPLIGIVPWGLVEGRQALWEPALWEPVPDGAISRHTDRIVLENFGDQEKIFQKVKPHGVTSVRLSRDHSHFIFVDDGTNGELHGEAAIRARLEASVNSADNRVLEEIRRTLQEKNLGWQMTNMQNREIGTVVAVVIKGVPKP